MIKGLWLDIYYCIINEKFTFYVLLLSNSEIEGGVTSNETFISDKIGGGFSNTIN